ncbi:Uncharacterized conserved protein YgbK, DUF1537 family [Mucilaginibacter mallensis]|uniref:Uncharacterized conserved protein YgbK, DUF1537 family n=1 Tax=Mucilaginibacter mallensis TaxID=652787 RepID=A0A1H1Y962_MUCMA|nr:four-carbon acid sugar kinase family protein [Mucilaginibacter mallensis]SDT18000.1 Uncharacterized conserved protein YgbK, DUF1537 family [Mucilaginibacter mallensis]
MIVVIADDLTGAAELGGIGLRYDLTVEIITAVNTGSKADLLIIATDTRSMPEEQALKEMETVTEKLKEINPDTIFKKVDSVLRGHVVSEIKVHLQKLGLGKALLVPANPAFGRTISNGRYFIKDKPIHLTSFAHDPEFAITSSRVQHMLRVDEKEIHLRGITDQLPDYGILIGECGTTDDLHYWASKADENTLLAGGSGFFIALLESLKLNAQIEADVSVTELTYPALFVCGSTHDESRQSIKKIKENSGSVSYMPCDIIKAENPVDSLFEIWADEIVHLLNSHKKAIIAIDEYATKGITITAADLRNKKAKVVARVFQKIAIKELLVEGGSTGAAIINRLKFNSFSPVKELGPGVIKMKVDAIDDLFLTLKPGSYNWPSFVWNF